jgi:hypothetical protein
MEIFTVADERAREPANCSSSSRRASRCSLRVPTAIAVSIQFVSPNPVILIFCLVSKYLLDSREEEFLSSLIMNSGGDCPPFSPFTMGHYWARCDKRREDDMPLHMDC